MPSRASDGVHVAAEVAGPQAAERFLAGRRDGEPAEHRLERHLDRLRRRVAAGRGCRRCASRSSRQTKRRAGSGSFSMRVRESPATALMPFGLTADTAVSRFGRSRTILHDQGVVAASHLRCRTGRPRRARAAGLLVVVAGLRERARLDDGARLQAQHRRTHGERRHACCRFEIDRRLRRRARLGRCAAAGRADSVVAA